MAITLVTSGEATASNGADIDQTFGTAPIEDDVVILIGGHSDNNSSGSAGGESIDSTTGVTALDATSLFDNENEMDAGVWYYVMTSDIETGIRGYGDGVAQHATAYVYYILRGVDLTQIADVATVKAGAVVTDGSAYDSPSITTVTDGAWVFSVGFGGGGNDPNVTTEPSGYVAASLHTPEAVDSIRMGVAVSYKEVTTAGEEDPGAYTDTGSTSDAWTLTFAIRPAGAGGGLSIPVAWHHYNTARRSA